MSYRGRPQHGGATVIPSSNREADSTLCAVAVLLHVTKGHHVQTDRADGVDGVLNDLICRMIIGEYDTRRILPCRFLFDWDR